MLKFLIIILLVAIYVAISYWLISKEGFGTAREYAQYLMDDADGYFACLIERYRNKHGEQWVRKFTVVYSIEIILILPILEAWFEIEYLFKK
jgi:hypothetical protein